MVEEGPPFEVERLGLERHQVFVSEREVVFFFEGDNATAAVDALSRNPRVLNAAVRWRGTCRSTAARGGALRLDPVNLTKSRQRYLRGQSSEPEADRGRPRA